MTKKTFLQVFLAVLIIRILIAVLMWPGADEAYYYLYSLHPDLSYFDHPPMVAWAGGMLPGLIGWVSPLSIRIGPMVLFSLAVYFFLLLAKRVMFDEEEAYFSAIIFAAVPMFFISGTLLLPDAALILFWVMGLYFFRKTLDSPVILNWFMFGIAAGFGMLSKYTAVFLYAGALIFIIINRRFRKLLFTPGPYIAALTSFILFSPVLLWNIMNGFESFIFQVTRVGSGSIKLRYFYQSLGGQMGYLLPFVFFPALYYAGKSIVRMVKGDDELNSMVICFGTLPLSFFLYSSLFKRVLPHWPVIAYILLIFPITKFYREMIKRKKKLFLTYAALHSALIILLVSAALLQVKTGLIFNRELPASGLESRKGVRDLSIDIIGWKELAEFIKKEYSSDDVFLFTHKWYLAGQIGFATKGRYELLCLNDKDDIRGFSVWQDQERNIGKDGIFISTSKFYRDPSDKYQDNFEGMMLVKSIPVRRSGKLVKLIYVYRCRKFKKIYPA